MNELIIQLCERLKSEADTVIDCMQRNAEIVKTGHEKSLDVIAMLENMAIDNIEHIQKLVLEISSCFFTTAEKQEEGKNE